jgi:hypothetical protein
MRINQAHQSRHKIAQPAEVLIRSAMAGDPTKRPPVENFSEATIHMNTIHRDRVMRKLQTLYGLTGYEAERALADAAPVLRYRGDEDWFASEVVRIHGLTELARIRIDGDCRGVNEQWYAIQLCDQNAGVYTYTVRHRAATEEALRDDIELAFGPNVDVDAISGPFDRFVDVYNLAHVEPGFSKDDLPECDVPDGPPVLMAGGDEPQDEAPECITDLSHST